MVQIIMLNLTSLTDENDTAIKILKYISTVIFVQDIITDNSTYKIAVIIEFDAHLSELEAPAWPTGGWVGYGGYSQNWGWGAPGRAARRQAQKKLSAQHKDDPQNPESVRLSDDPYLANMMLSSGESQALYIGH